MANDLSISPIPAFDDNYIWLLRRAGSDACVVVDPGDEDPVIETLQAQGLQLDSILITHKHGDHVGGVAGLKAHWPQVKVYGPANEPIRDLDATLGEGDRVSLDALGLELSVLDVPGHTEGHLAYVGEGFVFCGDTLFAGGCGRVFSGTFEQLSDSLQRLAALPPETAVYCAHEYTQANLGFAKWVEPENAALLAREAQVEKARSEGRATVPSLLQDELATNPFMRTQVPEVVQAAERWQGDTLNGAAAVFRALRTWKDQDYD